MDRRSFIRTGSTAFAVGAAGPALLSARGDGRVPEDALKDLAAKLKGKLLLPGSPDFAARNLPANDVYGDVRPKAIALCADARDVATCVTWCREEGVQPVVRGGGHNYVGASTTTGLPIKTTRMDKISVDERDGTVTVQAGALNGDLLATLRGGSLMLPIGTCPTVGVAGLTLGGGIGDNSRWAGMTSDGLCSTEVVLAPGHRVTADRQQNSDLLWACQGGADGNFGINTSMTFDLVPLHRRTITVYGMLFQGAERAAAAFAAFDKLMLTAPVWLSGFIGVTNQRPLGAAAGSPRASSLFPQLSLDGSYIGPADEFGDLLAPMTAAAAPAGYLVGEFEYWTAQIQWLAVPSQPKHGFAEGARFTNAALPNAAISEPVSRVSDAPGGTSDACAEARLLCWSGGHVINGVDPAATAYAHRDSNSLLQPAVWWTDTKPALQRDLLDWMSRSWDYIRPFTQDQSFQNWPYQSTKDWHSAYYGGNFPKLVAVKKRLENVFHYSQSIPTSV
jgi:FAD/FMN-containing dehydrogenase